MQDPYDPWLGSEGYSYYLEAATVILAVTVWIKELYSIYDKNGVAQQTFMLSPNRGHPLLCWLGQGTALSTPLTPSDLRNLPSARFSLPTVEK